MTVHVVTQGECAAQIADANGLKLAKLWDHPRNATLKRRRKDPNLLKQGDKLYIPERDQRGELCATGHHHRFRVEREPIELKLRLVTGPFVKPKRPEPPTDETTQLVTSDPEVELEYRPRKDLPYRLEIGSLHKTGKTDGDGMLRCHVPHQARAALLILNPDSDREERLRVRIGSLDPLDDDAGAMGRLANLGFAGDTREEQLLTFQMLHGLEPSGELDAATRAKLKVLHGS